MANAENKQASVAAEGSNDHESESDVDIEPEFSDPMAEFTYHLAMKKEPILISKLIKKYNDLPPALIVIYEQLIKKLTQKKNRPASDKKFIDDYMLSQMNIIKMLEANAAGKTETVYQEVANVKHEGEAQKSTGLSAVAPRSVIKPIKLNELVIRPEDFDGVKPPARKWIEDFEQAGYANGWTSDQMAKYLPTFLVKTARDWYLAVAMKKLGANANWPNLKKKFVEHYLGQSDLQTLQMQLDQMFQYKSESITCFMPRVLRSIDLVEPNMTETKRVTIIREKLRASYQKELTRDYICTLADLNELCLRIESNFRSIKRAEERELKEAKKEANKKNTDNQNNSNKSGENKKKGNANKYLAANTVDGKKSQEEKTLICYRCNRKGHYASKCKYDKKEDGTPVTAAPKKKVGMVAEVKAVANEPAPVVMVRKAGQSHVCNLVVGSGRLITHHIKVNGEIIEATIDTGAAVSVISYSVIDKHGWRLEPRNCDLVGATGKNLDCKGIIMANLAVTLGKRTVVVTHQLVVVKELCVPMLLGLDLITALGVIISPASATKLTFSREMRMGGVRAVEDVVLQPRTLNFVVAKVATDAATVAMRPYNFVNFNCKLG